MYMELMFFSLSYCRAGTDPAGFSFLYHSGLLERSIKTIETLLTPWNVCVSDNKFWNFISHLLLSGLYWLCE